MARPKRTAPWLDWRNGTAYVFWYSPDKRQTEKLSLGTRDPAIAQIKFGEFLVKGLEKKAAALTVSDALDAYLEEHVRPTCVDSAITGIGISIRHLKAYFGDLALRGVGVPESHAYVNWRVKGAGGRAAKHSTTGKELSILRAAANHAVKWKRLSLTDMPTFYMPKTPASKGVWLFKDEVDLLIDAAATLPDSTFPARTKAFITLCYYTGSRRNAIETLTWNQVDIARSRIALAKPGEKQTHKRRPTIAIDPLLRPTLALCERLRTNEYVLGAPYPMSQRFLAAAKAAGLDTLPERESRPAAVITPHMLRHSRATHLLQDGHSPWAVANLLGDTLTTVQRVYGHHCASHTEVLFREQPDLPLFDRQAGTNLWN